jgi:hypothetical protein
MEEQEATQIMAAIKEQSAEFRKLRLLIVGNGNKDAVLPRLQALEYLAKALKLLIPVITTLIIAGLMYAIFGST